MVFGTFNSHLIGLFSYSIAGMRALLEAFEDLRTRLTEATDRNKYFLTELERLQTDSAYSKTLLGHLQVCAAHKYLILTRRLVIQTIG